MLGFRKIKSGLGNRWDYSKIVLDLCSNPDRHRRCCLRRSPAQGAPASLECDQRRSKHLLIPYFHRYTTAWKNVPSNRKAHDACSTSRNQSLESYFPVPESYVAGNGTTNSRRRSQLMYGPTLQNVYLLTSAVDLQGTKGRRVSDGLSNLRTGRLGPQRRPSVILLASLCGAHTAHFGGVLSVAPFGGLCK